LSDFRLCCPRYTPGHVRIRQHKRQIISRDGSSNAGTPEQWANESLRLAGVAWVQDGSNLDEQYYQREIKVVDRQMALAGLRLAKLLNDTIGKMTPRDFASARQPDIAAPAATSPAIPAQAGGDASDVKVWANPRSMVYHCPATPYYGTTKHGEYMTQKEAREKGYHPAGGRGCK
jgi:S1/P1 Nuclease